MSPATRILNPGLLSLSRAQACVVARGQLRELDISRHAVRSAVRAGRWQLLGPRLVVLHNGPLERRQQEWAAVLHAGPTSALCGLSAAVTAGLRGFEHAPVHVVVPRGIVVPRLVVPQLHVQVHESRRFDEQDTHPARTPRQTRLPRSLIDAASWASTEGSARSILSAGVQQRLVSVPQLRDELAGAGAVRRGALLHETINDVEGGSQSLPELEWLQLLRWARLPMPARQAKVRRPDGTYYLDGYWQEYELGAEVNGAQHDEVLVREYDDQRRNELVIARRRMLAFSSYAVRRKRLVVATTIYRALCAFGWRPPSDCPLRLPVAS